MKPMKKIILAGLFSCILSTTAFPCIAKTPEVYAAKPANEISPRTDKLVWKYMNINGVLHRRLYNTTQGIWIGDWEPVN